MYPDFEWGPRYR